MSTERILEEPENMGKEIKVGFFGCFVAVPQADGTFLCSQACCCLATTMLQCRARG